MRATGTLLFSPCCSVKSIPVCSACSRTLLIPEYINLPIHAVTASESSSIEPTAKEMIWPELPSTIIPTGNKNRLLASLLCLAMMAFLNWEYLEISGFRKASQGSVVDILQQSGWNKRTKPTKDVASEPNDVNATKNADPKIIHPNVPLFVSPNKCHIVYSNARQDRSGSAISDMLAAHAYAFHQNMTYGGACLPDEIKHFTKQKFEKRIRQHQALIDAIGLNGVIGFLHCSTNQRAELIPSKQYSGTDALWYSPAWLEYMHQHIDYPILSKKKKNSNSNSTRLEVAVHLRRADIQPCNHWSYRYLPNSYYQRILDEYLVEGNKTAHVTIFSEKNSFETMTAFSAKNYTLKLDTDLTTAWIDIMTADIVVLSCSAFSYVPALLNPKARVIYTEFHMQPLEGWEVIRRNSTFMKPAQEEVEQMKNKCTKQV